MLIITYRFGYKIGADCLIDRPYSSNSTTCISPNYHVINRPKEKNKDLYTHVHQLQNLQGLNLSDCIFRNMAFKWKF